MNRLSHRQTDLEDGTRAFLKRVLDAQMAEAAIVSFAYIAVQNLARGQHGCGAFDMFLYLRRKSVHRLYFVK